MIACLIPDLVGMGAVLAILLWAVLAAETDWLRRQMPFFGKLWFLIAHAALLLWLAAVILRLMVSDEHCLLFWERLAALPMVVLLTAWAFFLLDHSFLRRSTCAPWQLVLLIGGPVVVGLAMAANALEPRLVAAVDGAGPSWRLAVAGLEGMLSLVMGIYLFLLLSAGLLISVLGVARTTPRYRPFYLRLPAIAALPLVANAANLLGGVTLAGHDPTPFVFALVLLAFTWTIFNDRLMDITTVANDLLFYNTVDPIIVFDVEGRLAGLNPEAQRLLHRSLPAIGGDLRQIAHVGEVVRNVLDGHGRRAAKPLTIGARHFDLRVLPIEKPLDRTRSAMGWVLVMNDATERRFLSDQLLAERDFLSKLMDTSISGIMALDECGRIIYANREAEQIFGYPQAALCKLRYDDPLFQIEPVGHHGPGAPLRQLLAATAPERDRRFSLQRADGSRRVVSVNSAPISHPNRSARVVLAVADITEQVAAERDLRQAVDRAEAASRIKSQFLANMSHEIRTPLNGVLGMAEVLDRAVTDAEHKRMVTTIRRSGEMLLTILNDVLDMSKIEAGKMELERVAFRPDELALRVDEMHRQMAEEKGLALEVYASVGADAPRTGDPLRIMQILQNLVSNAVKFTEAGEVVVTFSCPRGAPMVIEVRDTGIGMTERQSERIFEEFEQADGSMTRRFGGTGLGMAIVRRLVESMGGAIAIDSAPGQGTTVRVTLPLPEAV
ncbi:MAG: hypothetical protein JG765_1934 [Cereibacter sp.]|jgi:PAS domain S-box-containing protein|nr:hypothetical protein [Cereibacter sp.]